MVSMTQSLSIEGGRVVEFPESQSCVKNKRSANKKEKDSAKLKFVELEEK